MCFLKKSNGKYQDKQINKFAALIDFDHSKAFIEQSIQLISQETIDYLKSWAIDLETENVKFVFHLKLHKRITLFVDVY